MFKLREIQLKKDVRRLDIRLIFVLILAVEAAIFWLDLLTGPLVSFAPYFIITIALSTWYIGRKTAYFFVILSSVARVYVFGRILPENNYYYAYDLFQSILIYSTFEILVSRIKRLVEKLSLYADVLENQVSYTDKKDKLDATIRRATPEDIDGIMLLVDIAAKADLVNADIHTPERRQEVAVQFKKWIEDGYFVRKKWNGDESEASFELWVSILENEFAGLCMIVGIDGRVDIKRELHLIVVREEFREIGLGSAMLDFFCKHYANHRLFVVCKPGSRMLEMILRRGFAMFSGTAGKYIIFVRTP